MFYKPSRLAAPAAFKNRTHPPATCHVIGQKLSAAFIAENLLRLLLFFIIKGFSDKIIR